MASIRFSPANVSGVLSQMGQSNVVDGAREERARQEARGVREQSRQDRAVEQMLKNPANAEAIAKAYGVPITQELGALLQQPALAQKVLEASKLAQGMGIENPEARKIFAQKYVETGDLMQAGDAIDGLELGKPLTEYQRQYLDVARTRASRTGGGSGTGRLKSIPANFIRAVESNLDARRGVRWQDPRMKNGLLEGSAAPLSPETVAMIANRAAGITQQTGNAQAAIDQAFAELGGEQGLADGAESPIGYITPSGTVRKDLGRVKYKQAVLPQDDTSSSPVPTAPVQSTPPDPGAKMSPKDTAATMRDLGWQEDNGADNPWGEPSVPSDSAISDFSLHQGLKPLPGITEVPQAPTATPQVPVPARVSPQSAGSTPIQVNTPEEAMSLKPGTIFISPDGKKRVR